jgi:hypothetical protein
LSPGDIIVEQRTSGDWATVKILFVDNWPDGDHVAHVFSRAECHLRLGDHAIAEQQFSEAMLRFPEHLENLEKYRNLARRAMNSADSP